jgi:hypothetical protein
MLLLLPFCAALLSGCASDGLKPVVRYETRIIEVPKSLRQCDNRPIVPKDPITQRKVATFVNDLDEAYSDCKSKLNGVDQILSKGEAEFAHAKR